MYHVGVGNCLLLVASWPTAWGALGPKLFSVSRLHYAGLLLDLQNNRHVCLLPQEPAAN